MTINSHINESIKRIAFVIAFLFFTIVLPYFVLSICCAALKAFSGISCTFWVEALIALLMSHAAAHIFFRIHDTLIENRLREESDREIERILEQLCQDCLEDSSEEHW